MNTRFTIFGLSARPWISVLKRLTQHAPEILDLKPACFAAWAAEGVVINHADNMARCTVG